MAKLGGWVHYWTARHKRRDYLKNTSQAIDFSYPTRPWHAFQNHALNILELLKATSETDGQMIRQNGVAI